MSEIWSKMYIGLHVKYRLFLSDFNGTWIFSTNFWKNTQIRNFMKIRPLGANCPTRTDGQTERRAEMTKVIVDSSAISIRPLKIKDNPRPHVRSSKKHRYPRPTFYISHSPHLCTREIYPRFKKGTSVPWYSSHYTDWATFPYSVPLLTTAFPCLQEKVHLSCDLCGSAQVHWRVIWPPVGRHNRWL